MGRTYGRKGNSRSKSCENGKMIQISTYLLKFADTDFHVPLEVCRYSNKKEGRVGKVWK
jgi:hypothetical protein